jgi:hypothetical protein
MKPFVADAQGVERGGRRDEGDDGDRAVVRGDGSGVDGIEPGGSAQKSVGNERDGGRQRDPRDEGEREAGVEGRSR